MKPHGWRAGDRSLTGVCWCSTRQWSADTAQIEDFFFDFHLDFVENLCTPRCLLKHGSMLEQGAAAVDSRRNCFSPVQALPLPWKMKKPIKSLMDVACAAGMRACSLLIVTEDDIIHRWPFLFTMDLDRECYKHIHVSIDRQEVCKRNIWMFWLLSLCRKFRAANNNYNHYWLFCLVY